MYKKTGHKQIELTEVGPRFEMKPYQIKLGASLMSFATRPCLRSSSSLFIPVVCAGTIDMVEAETEWVLRPYMNTAKKRKAL